MHRRLSACLRFAWIAVVCMPMAAQATLYRCPSPFGEGSVVTNLVSDAEAKERACQPLQTRRSTLDGPMREERVSAPAPAPRRQPAERSTSERSVAERISDEWMAGSKPKASSRSVAPPAADSRAGSERRVAADVQRERDSDRRVILESELNRELQAMSKTQQQAKAVPAGGDERQRLDEALARHVANVDALKRELSRIR